MLTQVKLNECTECDDAATKKDSCVVGDISSLTGMYMTPVQLRLSPPFDYICWDCKHLFVLPIKIKNLVFFIAFTFGIFFNASAIILPIHTSLVAYIYDPNPQTAPQGLWSLDVDLKWISEPANGWGYYAMMQFWFEGNSTGYMGLQKDDSGKTAIFSMWDTNNGSVLATPAHPNCQRFGHEGAGTMCFAKNYNWIAGRDYKLRLWKGFNDKSWEGNSWSAWIQDSVTGVLTQIGDIHVDNAHGFVGYGNLQSVFQSTLEYYAGNLNSSCAQMPYAGIEWKGHAVNDRSLYSNTAYPNYDTAVGTKCPNVNIKSDAPFSVTQEAGGQTVPTPHDPFENIWANYPLTPVCTLSASPASINAGGTSTLTASCSRNATSYFWTGGTCAGNTAATCTVTPSTTTSYSVAGINAAGTGTAVSASVTVTVSMPTALAHAYYNFPQPGPFDNLDVYLKWDNDPVVTPQVGVYPGFSFSFQNGAAGFFGTLSDANGKNSIFSIWDASSSVISALPIGANCVRFGNEGTGTSCYTPYVWVPGREYRLRLWKSGRVGGADQWTATIVDTTTQLATTIGVIALNDGGVYQGYGGLTNSMASWVQHYGSGNVACSALPQTKVTWRGPYVNSGQTSATAAIAEFFQPACLNSNISANMVPVVTIESGGATVRRAGLVSGINVWESLVSMVPVCTLTATPSVVSAGGSSTLTPSCSPVATSYAWLGGTCAGTSGPTCTVTPAATTIYSVIGANANGSGSAASSTVTVTAPVVSMAPSVLTFSDQIVGTTSPAQAITLSNTGNASLGIASITSTLSVFAVNHNCGANLAANANCTLNVTFSPSAVGTRLGAITLNSNATGNPHSVMISGVGVVSNAPVCTLNASPTSVRKNGTSTLIVSCNPAATSFTWTGGTCAGVAAATCTVTPTVTTIYSVIGRNSYGSSASSASVTVKAVDLTPILMLLLD